ncbi:cytochrome P450 oxidoreductase [Whalleya microplaca]|nr:cytochrome P450 oxidoreductase [Whalleya microplaca]
MFSTSAVKLLTDYWLAVGITILACWILSNRYKRGLHRVPGPWLRSVSSLPRIWSVYRGFSHDDDLLLHRKYGSIVRLAPNTLSVSDPSEINTIYGIGTKFIKSSFYSLAEAYDEEGVMPDPFVITNREYHTRMKRGAANAYSLNGLVQMEPWIDPVTSRLVQILRAFSQTKEAVDIAELMQGYAMDAICALTFGKDFNHMDGGDHLGFYKNNKFANDYMAIFGQFAWCHRYLLGNAQIQKLVYNGEGNAKMLQLCDAEIAIGRDNASEDGPMTFLQRLLLNQKQNPKSLTDRELVTHSFNNIAAGSDTTAIGLRSIIYNTLKDPRVHYKLTEEVRTSLKLPVTFVEANKLPYLSAVIKEGIRLHPSVGMILARIVPEGGTVICGKPLQAGVEVGVNPWVLQRDPNVYTNPDQFYPDRWLPENTPDDQLKAMNRSFIPFGQGAHTCSGRWISTMELVKVISTIFYMFDMELVDGGKEYRYHNLWFTAQKGLVIKVNLAEGT